MGGKNSTSTSSTSIPPEILQRYNAVNARAEDAASTQFEPYPGQFVADLSGSQQAGIENTNALAGAAQPFINAGADLTLGSAASIQPDQYSGQAVNQFMSPYIGSVYNATAANIDRSNAVQQQSMIGDQIKQNAFGGDRGGIQRAELARSQNLAGQQTLANVLNTGFQGAQTEFNQQQQIGLGADQNTAARMAQAGQGLAAMGVQGQQAGLAGAKQQMDVGQVEQGTNQADLTAQYNQYLQYKSYPFQLSQFLANIAEGTGALSGSTTTNTSPAPFFSDERLKENVTPVGESFDGQTIYRYNYKGDNRTQIGLLAQEVAHKAPEAVGQDRGYLTVDYDKATRGAAERGLGHAAHRASGGGLSIDPYASAAGGSPYPTPKAYVPPPSLPVGSLATSKVAAKSGSTGLADAANSAKQFTSLAKDAKGVFDWGKDKIGNFGYEGLGGLESRGGRIGYGNGGDVDDSDDLDAPEAGKPPNVHSYVPKADLPVGSLKTSAPTQNNAKSPFGEIMDAAKMVASFAMMSRGGGIGHYAGGGAAMDPDEMAIRTLYREAGNEPDDGVAGVAHVIQNRVNAGGYGDGLAGVITKPKQFSPWNTAGTGSREDPLTVDMQSPGAQRAAAIWQRVKAGEIPDPTGGALNFANVATVHAQNPGNRWVDRMQNPVQIGHHTFGTAGGTGRDASSAIARAAPSGGLGSARAYAEDPEGLRRPVTMQKPFPRVAQAEGLGSASDAPEPSLMQRLAKAAPGDDSNQKLAIAAGLFGMLSSKSHWLLPAIGEGGLAGINTYKDLEKQKADIENTNASASLTRTQAGQHSLIKDSEGNIIGVLANGSFMPYQTWLKNQKTLTGFAPSGQTVGDNLRSNGSPDAKPYGDVPPTTVGANGQPESRGQRPSVAGPAAGSAAPANPRIERTDLPPPSGGQPTRVPPPAAPADLHPELAKAAIGELGTQGTQGDKTARELGDKIVKESQDAAEVNRASSNLQNDLALSVSSAPRTGWQVQGTGAGTRYAAAKAVNTLGNFLGAGDLVDPNTLKWKDINEKLSVLNANNLKGDMKAAYALDMFKHTQPNLEMTPQTAATMVAQLYRMRQRAIDRADVASKYTTASQGRGKDFDTTFNKVYPNDQYEREAKAIEDMMLRRASKKGDRTMMDLFLNGEIPPEVLKKNYPGVDLQRYFGGAQRSQNNGR